jgi:prefoldin alpha subunit
VQLKEAQDRFVQNISTVTSLRSAEVGQEMLIPLTPTVFVNAELSVNDKVMIDVGTGYFIEKVILHIPKVSLPSISFRI